MTDEAVPDPVRRIAPTAAGRTEWLVCNGLGGYAAGIVHGPPTRRYHGLLVAALPNPSGRVMMLSSLAVQLRLPGGRRLDVGWVPDVLSAGAALPLVEFRLELGLPIWTYAAEGVVVERRHVLTHRQNTAMIRYCLKEGGPARLELRPALQFRGHDEPVSTAIPEAYELSALGSRVALEAPPPLPPLQLHVVGGRTSFVIEPRSVPDLSYATEEMRGYASRGQLYSPGRFRADLAPGETVALFASTESWDTLLTMSPDEALAAELDRRRRLLDAAAPPARRGVAAELVLAADAFVIQPAGRREDHVPARAPRATRRGP